MSAITRMLTLAGVLGSLCLTACDQPRDAAAEAPVDPAPGLYKVTLTGAGLDRYAQGPGRTQDEICVTASESPRFAERLARNYFSMHEACTSKVEPRTGNAIAGVITCGLDPQRAAGSMTVAYTGTVSADAVTANGQMKIDARPVPGSMTPEETQQIRLAAAMMEQVGIVVTATRTGDCV